MSRMLSGTLVSNMHESERRINLSPEANNDLISIWIYGATEWSPEQADKHLFEIESVCDRLLGDTQLGKPRDELVVGVRSIVIRPHVIFYRVSKTRIEILRVLHQRKDVDTIFAAN